jgi:hypothetical protein
VGSDIALLAETARRDEDEDEDEDPVLDPGEHKSINNIAWSGRAAQDISTLQVYRSNLNRDFNHSNTENSQHGYLHSQRHH